MTEHKFITRPSSILGKVEESYIKFIGESQELSNYEFLKEFKNVVQATTNHTVHAQILQRNKTLVIIETSKYVKGTGQFTDHQIWTFSKHGDNRYNWTLKRHTII